MSKYTADSGMYRSQLRFRSCRPCTRRSKRHCNPQPSSTRRTRHCCTCRPCTGRSRSSECHPAWRTSPRQSRRSSSGPFRRKRCCFPSSTSSSTSCLPPTTTMSMGWGWALGIRSSCKHLRLRKGPPECRDNPWDAQRITRGGGCHRSRRARALGGASANPRKARRNRVRNGNGRWRPRSCGTLLPICSAAPCGVTRSCFDPPGLRGPDPLGREDRRAASCSAARERRYGGAHLRSSPTTAGRARARSAATAIRGQSNAQ